MYEVRFEGLENNASKLKSSQIKGSPSWTDEWQPASLYSKTGKIITVPVRLNLAANEIQFLKNGEELVITDKDITRIVFINKKIQQFLSIMCLTCF